MTVNSDGKVSLPAGVDQALADELAESGEDVSAFFADLTAGEAEVATDGDAATPAPESANGQDTPPTPEAPEDPVEPVAADTAPEPEQPTEPSEGPSPAERRLQSERDQLQSEVGTMRAELDQIRQRETDRAQAELRNMPAEQFRDRMIAEMDRPPDEATVRKTVTSDVMLSGVADPVLGFATSEEAQTAFAGARTMVDYNKVIWDRAQASLRTELATATNAAAARRNAGAPQTPAETSGTGTPTVAQLEARLADPSDPFGSDEDLEKLQAAMPAGDRRGLGL